MGDYIVCMSLGAADVLPLTIRTARAHTQPCCATGTRAAALGVALARIVPLPVYDCSAIDAGMGYE